MPQGVLKAFQGPPKGLGPSWGPQHLHILLGVEAEERDELRSRVRDRHHPWVVVCPQVILEPQLHRATQRSFDAFTWAKIKQQQAEGAAQSKVVMIEEEAVAPWLSTPAPHAVGQCL